MLWCYLRNPAFKTKEADYHLAADLTGQANHLGVTIEADVIMQKQRQTVATTRSTLARRTKQSTRTSRLTILDLTRYQLISRRRPRAPANATLVKGGHVDPRDIDARERDRRAS